MFIPFHLGPNLPEIYPPEIHTYKDVYCTIVSNGGQGKKGRERNKPKYPLMKDWLRGRNLTTDIPLPLIKFSGALTPPG